ncbi:large ribosomal subunit protein mL48 isoform X2 [Myripristis murdjan]|uniref:large ribosomal subunit protein mL48 isoform X2 n=1 Tax=Myripristis murdjan TaxID=586833 RepID=UPI0011762145|nr:39S ribosomal protein L48, mitochondrial isoform X2 [Myripristis murdjan]
MNPVIRKVSLAQHSLLLTQTSAFLNRASASIQHPLCGGVAPGNERHYRSMPTHGIGRWRHLLPKEAPKKKKDKHQMKQIAAATNTEYGTLNVKVSGYDMTVVEHYSQYIHNLCNRLGIKVAESYALPTKTTEVMLMQEQGTKMYVDAVLKTHERIVQLSHLNAALCPTFMDVILKNQPEGIELCIKEHTAADYQVRFKARPELEGLIAQMGQKDH